MNQMISQFNADVTQLITAFHEVSYWSIVFDNNTDYCNLPGAKNITIRPWKTGAMSPDQISQICSPFKQPIEFTCGTDCINL